MNKSDRETGNKPTNRIPSSEVGSEFPGVNHSPELGAFLTTLMQQEQQRRDLQREKELAKLRDVQQFD